MSTSPIRSAPARLVAPATAESDPDDGAVDLPGRSAGAGPPPDGIPWSVTPEMVDRSPAIGGARGGHAGGLGGRLLPSPEAAHQVAAAQHAEAAHEQGGERRRSSGRTPRGPGPRQRPGHDLGPVAAGGAEFLRCLLVADDGRAGAVRLVHRLAVGEQVARGRRGGMARPLPGLLVVRVDRRGRRRPGSEIRYGPGRVDQEHLLNVLSRPLPIADSVAALRPDGEGGGVAGVEGQGVGGVGDGLVEDVPPLEYLGPDDVRAGPLRVEPDGHGEIGQRPLGLPEPAVGLGPQQVGGDRLAVQPDRLGGPLGCLVELALGQVHPRRPEQLIDLGRRRTHRHLRSHAVPSPAMGATGGRSPSRFADRNDPPVSSGASSSIGDGFIPASPQRHGAGGR